MTDRSPSSARLRRRALTLSVPLLTAAACGQEFAMDTRSSVVADGADASFLGGGTAGPDDGGGAGSLVDGSDATVSVGPGGSRGGSPSTPGTGTGGEGDADTTRDGGHRGHGDGGRVPPLPGADAAPLPDPTPTSCDQDGDGYKAVRCGGNDCCDTDDQVYPAPTDDFFTKPNACGSYDYDCDGVIAERYAPAVECKRNVLFKCAGEGFIGETACGAEAVFLTCEPDHAKCSARQDARTQGCR